MSHDTDYLPEPDDRELAEMNLQQELNAAFPADKWWDAQDVLQAMKDNDEREDNG
jgi:hypothetical protein